MTYGVRFTNVGDESAWTVVLRAVLPEGGTYLGPATDLQEGVWTRVYSDVPPGSYVESIPMRLSAAAMDGDRPLLVVELRYATYAGVTVTRTYALEFAVSFPAGSSSGPALPLWLAAFPLLPGIAGAGVVVSRRRHRPHLEQVFLMHSSGMLIHHWAASSSPGRDIDILSGMFVILKEFVRDSFREKAGGLTELHFGDCRMFLAEGRHSILAAVVSGARTNGIPGQIEAAVADFERRDGDVLARWSGQLDRLPHAKDVVERLVRGAYRRLGAAG